MIFTKLALLEDTLEELEYLQLLADVHEDREVSIMRRFFENIDCDALESQLEVIQGVRNRCSRNDEFEYTEALDDIMTVLDDLKDSAESCRLCV